MKKIFGIVLCVVICFVIESLLYEIVGRWFRPNLLIILVVFFNLFRGIRYSLLAAFLAGILKDSFAFSVFGLHTFAFVFCAFLATVIKQYLYLPGSRVSRVIMVFIIANLNIFIQYVLSLMFVPVGFWEMVRVLLFPEVLATTIITTYVFEKLKSCVSVFFV